MQSWALHTVCIGTKYMNTNKKIAFGFYGYSQLNRNEMFFVISEFICFDFLDDGRDLKKWIYEHIFLYHILDYFLKYSSLGELSFPVCLLDSDLHQWALISPSIIFADCWFFLLYSSLQFIFFSVSLSCCPSVQLSYNIQVTTLLNIMIHMHNWGVDPYVSEKLLCPHASVWIFFIWLQM